MKTGVGARFGFSQPDQSAGAVSELIQPDATALGLVQPLLLADAGPEPAPPEPTAIEIARQAWDARGHRALADVLAGRQVLVAERAAEPKISVIVILRNKAALSVMAIASLIEHVDVPYELIIVDNASTDETPRMLELIEGLQVLRFEQNMGFGPACNLAAKRARGEYLLFFNNDALLGSGAVRAALRVFDDLPRVGAVGGKIILSDGTLQELGAFIWSDGLTRGYGRGDDPNLDRYARRLACDYCSGAFLLTPRALFESLGEFDARYAPAYYEDADYCVALWSRGYAVVVEPAALVQHYESATSVEAATTLSAINREKFCQKWADWLADRPGDSPETMQGLIAPGFARARAAESRFQQAEAQTRQAEAQTRQAEAQTRQAEAQVRQAETRTRQAEAQTRQAEARAEELHSTLQAVYASRSWRLTYPLRWVNLQQVLLRQHGMAARGKALFNKVARPLARNMACAPGFDAAPQPAAGGVFQGLIAKSRQGVRRWIVVAIKWAGDHARRSPRFKRFVLRLLRLHPGFQAKLRRVYLENRFTNQSQQAKRSELAADALIKPDGDVMSTFASSGINSGQRSPLEANIHNYLDRK